eukprot:SM000186S04133  [mRNA]  locus=s186:152262:159568:+ [translate_table: standard]
MESLLAAALDSKLRYYLKTYSRDQFRLTGRTVQLSNLAYKLHCTSFIMIHHARSNVTQQLKTRLYMPSSELNGFVLHAILGLPSTVHVAQAKVEKLEIKLPTFSNISAEPTVVSISTLDLVISETLSTDFDAAVASAASAASKSTSYGFADKIADGMTVEVGTLNLTVETKGRNISGGQAAAAWIPPMASITLKGVTLMTTNESWQVVNLNDTRQFFKDRKCIYIFRKLEWSCLSIDLLPHPDMFLDDKLVSPQVAGSGSRGADGAKRAFFGGERFLDNITGVVHVTMHRSETNNPIGLEVDLELSDALCPAVSEPGLRALMRCMTGMYGCLNRADRKPVTQVQLADAASRSYMKASLSSIFLRIKETDFQLELLLHSLTYVKASCAEGLLLKGMSWMNVESIILRDTFSQQSCVLIQPGTSERQSPPKVAPSFANDALWPRIYPLAMQEDDMPEGNIGRHLIMIFSTQTTPTPAPPAVASQLVLYIRPLEVHLQEEACLRIASLLADSMTGEKGTTTFTPCLQYILLCVDDFHLILPVSGGDEVSTTSTASATEGASTLLTMHSTLSNCERFTGARLHLQDLVVCQDPSLRFRLLQVEKDAACFSLWPDQPVNTSSMRISMSAGSVTFALESGGHDSGLWRCVEADEWVAEIAMVTADGSPLVLLPPPGGVVRLGIYCKHYVSNTSKAQLAFVLRMYSYLGRVSRTLVKVGKGKEQVLDPKMGLQSLEERRHKNVTRSDSSLTELVALAPGDSSFLFKLDMLEFKLLDGAKNQLARFLGGGLSTTVTHRSFGGAAAVTSSLLWLDVRLELVDTALSPLARTSEAGGACHAVSNEALSISSTPHMRAVLWKGECQGSIRGTAGVSHSSRLPFIDINVVHVIPFNATDDSHELRISAKVGGVRLGGGMAYNEALLYHFGVLSPGGAPSKDIVKLVTFLYSGELANIFRPISSPTQSFPLGTHATGNCYLRHHVTTFPAVSEPVELEEGEEANWKVSMPNEMDLDLQLLDWLFAIEGAQLGVSGVQGGVADTEVEREAQCWHSQFRRVRILAKKAAATPTTAAPLQALKVSMEGLQALKPQLLKEADGNGSRVPPVKPPPKSASLANMGIAGQEGLDLELRLVSRSSSATVTHEATSPSNDPATEWAVGDWCVESVHAAMSQPFEVEATQAELHHLLELVKAESAAASRIAAAILKLLQMDNAAPLAHSAVTQFFGSRETGRENDPGHDQKGLTSVVDAGWKKIAAEAEAVVKRSTALCDKLRRVGEVKAGATPELPSELGRLEELAEQMRHLEELLTSLRR